MLQASPFTPSPSPEAVPAGEAAALDLVEVVVTLTVVVDIVVVVVANVVVEVVVVDELVVDVVVEAVVVVGVDVVVVVTRLQSSDVVLKNLADTQIFLPSNGDVAQYSQIGQSESPAQDWNPSGGAHSSSIHSRGTKQCDANSQESLDTPGRSGSTVVQLVYLTLFSETQIGLEATIVQTSPAVHTAFDEQACI